MEIYLLADGCPLQIKSVKHQKLKIQMEKNPLIPRHSG